MAQYFSTMIFVKYNFMDILRISGRNIRGIHQTFILNMPLLVTRRTIFTRISLVK